MIVSQYQAICILEILIPVITLLVDQQKNMVITDQIQEIKLLLIAYLNMSKKEAISKYMIDPIKLKVIQMREQLGLPEPYGDLEDKIIRIKTDIAIMNGRLDRNHEGRVRKAELSHNEEPSLSLSERLAASPSFRNAVRT